MAALENPGGLPALDRVAGLQRAAAVLLRRLYEKDPKRWLAVVAASPPELIPPWPEQPSHEDLGRAVQAHIRTLNAKPRGGSWELRADGTLTRNSLRTPAPA